MRAWEQHLGRLGEQCVVPSEERRPALRPVLCEFRGPSVAHVGTRGAVPYDGPSAGGLSGSSVCVSIGEADHLTPLCSACRLHTPLSFEKARSIVVVTAVLCCALLRTTCRSLQTVFSPPFRCHHFAQVDLCKVVQLLETVMKAVVTNPVQIGRKALLVEGLRGCLV